MEARANPTKPTLLPTKANEIVYEINTSKDREPTPTKALMIPCDLETYITRKASVNSNNRQEIYMKVTVVITRFNRG